MLLLGRTGDCLPCSAETTSLAFCDCVHFDQAHWDEPGAKNGSCGNCLGFLWCYGRRGEAQLWFRELKEP